MQCSRKNCENKSKDYIICAQCFKQPYCSDECLESDWFSGHETGCEGHLFNLSEFVPCSNTLGSGAYSEVKLFNHVETNTLYAIKIINKSILSVLLPIQTLFREIAIHKSLNHENIIKLYDQLEDSTKIYIILEYTCSTSLSQFLKNKHLTEHTMARIVVEISLALRYLHEKGIIHRDIKPENILVTSEGTVKICDLGWSSFCEGPRKTYCGTLLYMAPELTEGLEYSFPADVWGIGLILYEMLTQKNPFIGLNEEEKLQKIKSKNYDFQNTVSKAAVDLVKKILDIRPEKRFTIVDILKHRWINENFFYPNNIEAGCNVFHNDFGNGVVTFVKGLMCSIDFTGFSLEFAIPELVKNCKVLSGDTDMSDSFKSEIVKVVVSLESSEGSIEKSWKNEESMLESTADPFILDLSEVPEKSFTTVDKKKELIQLQTLIEPQKFARKQTRKTSRSLIDSLF